MTNSNSKFITFENGTKLRPYVIAGINATDNGVAVTNSSGDLVVFIEADSDAKKRRVIDLIAGCCDEGKKFVQPDFSFLKSEVAQ